MEVIVEFELLNQSNQNCVLRATAVVHLSTLNGIMAIKVERNRYNQEFKYLPRYKPLELVKLSTASFVRFVSKHKKHILHALDAEKLKKITDQHGMLVKAVARGPSLKSTLDSDSQHSFCNKVWRTLAHEYSSLSRFTGGLASVMPTTSHVKTDFFFFNYQKNDYDARPFDFSLERVLFSSQLKELDA